MSVPAFPENKKASISGKSGSKDFHRKALILFNAETISKPCNTRGNITNKAVCRQNASLTSPAHGAYLIRRFPRILPALSLCFERLWLSVIFKGINWIRYLGWDNLQKQQQPHPKVLIKCQIYVRDTGEFKRHHLPFQEHSRYSLAQQIFTEWSWKVDKNEIIQLTFHSLSKRIYIFPHPQCSQTSTGWALLFVDS